MKEQHCKFSLKVRILATSAHTASGHTTSAHTVSGHTTSAHTASGKDFRHETFMNALNRKLAKYVKKAAKFERICDDIKELEHANAKIAYSMQVNQLVSTAVCVHHSYRSCLS